MVDFIIEQIHNSTWKVCKEKMYDEMNNEKLFAFTTFSNTKESRNAHNTHKWTNGREKNKYIYEE